MQTYRMDLRTRGGGRVSWDKVREWHGHIYTTKCKIASQWEAAAQHREISLVLCDHLEGWDREGGREGDARGQRYGDICICITDSLFFLKGSVFLFFCLIIYLFLAVRGLSLVVASGGHFSLRCAGLSLSRPPLLRSTGSRCTGSVIVAHGPSYSAACGILPDQGSNPCPLHWQADSQPLRHQGSP